MAHQIEVKSVVAGLIYAMETTERARVAKGDPLIIIESMKMEIVVEAPSDGTVISLLVEKGNTVAQGQVLAVLSVS